MANHDLTFFQSIPWCASLINDPRHVILPTNSREPKPTTEDSLFGDTLKTNRTISACLSLCKKPATPNARIDEVMSLLSLGSGINGYPHVCHGGIVATMLDEVMGVLLAVNEERELNTARAAGGPVERIAVVTAELVIKYLKPVATPQNVCVRTWFSKIEGRKVWIQGTIEDETGTILARGEAIFVQIRMEKL